MNFFRASFFNLCDMARISNLFAARFWFLEIIIVEHCRIWIFEIIDFPLFWNLTRSEDQVFLQFDFDIFCLFSLNLSVCGFFASINFKLKRILICSNHDVYLRSDFFWYHHFWTFVVSGYCESIKFCFEIWQAENIKFVCNQILICWDQYFWTFSIMFCWEHQLSTFKEFDLLRISIFCMRIYKKIQIIILDLLCIWICWE